MTVATHYCRIKDQLLDTESRYIVERGDRVRGYQNGGYSHHGGGAGAGAEQRAGEHDTQDTQDLASMGYSIYSGGRQRDNQENIPMR